MEREQKSRTEIGITWPENCEGLVIWVVLSVILPVSKHVFQHRIAYFYGHHLNFRVQRKTVDSEHVYFRKVVLHEQM